MSNASDLLYTGEASGEFITEVTEAFPAGTYEKVWDEIHGWRVETEIPEIDNHTWYKFLIQSGWHEASLSFQLTLHDKDSIQVIKDVLAQIKAEKHNKE